MGCSHRLVWQAQTSTDRHREAQTGTDRHFVLRTTHTAFCPCSVHTGWTCTHSLTRPFLSINSFTNRKISFCSQIPSTSVVIKAILTLLLPSVNPACQADSLLLHNPQYTVYQLVHLTIFPSKLVNVQAPHSVCCPLYIKLTDVVQIVPISIPSSSATKGFHIWGTIQFSCPTKIFAPPVL